MKSLRETFSPHKGKKAVSEPSQAAHVVAEASTPFRGQQNILQEAAQNRQRANNLVARMRWAESDKGSFKNLIKKLRHDNDYFGSILGLQKSLQMNETRAILEDQTPPNLISASLDSSCIELDSLMFWLSHSSISCWPVIPWITTPAYYSITLAEEARTRQIMRWRRSALRHTTASRPSAPQPVANPQPGSSLPARSRWAKTR